MHITIPAHDCLPEPTLSPSRRYDAALRAAKWLFSEQLEIRRTFGRLGRGAAISNGELASLLRVSHGEASKIVSRHPKLLRRQRLGRVVMITLH